MVAAPFQGAVTAPGATSPLSLALGMALLAGRQQRRAETAEKRLLDVHQLLTRHDLDPAQKVSGYVTVAALGALPGDPNLERVHEFKGVFMKDLAEDMGLSEKVAGGHVEAWAQAGAVEKKPITIRRVDADGVRRPHTYLMLKPTAAVRSMATMPAPPKTNRQKANAVYSDANPVARKKAQCPACGSTDVKVTCLACGTITMAADLPDLEAAHGAVTALHTRERFTKRSRSISGEIDHGAVTAPWQCEGDVPPADDPTLALAAALDVLAPAVTPFDTHLEMLQRTPQQRQKYRDVKDPLTPDLIERHLRGQGPPRATRLCSLTLEVASGREGHAIAWDADTPEQWKALVTGAYKLRQAGLVPLLCKNPSEEGRGHLWLFFDAPVDAPRALAAAEKIAPTLTELAERFPNQGTGNQAPGGRLRLPGGRYLVDGGPAVNVLVALAPRYGHIEWADGTTPAGWATIGASLSSAAILRDTWIPPEKRPAPVGQTILAQQTAQRAAQAAASVPDGAGFDFARFNTDNPVPNLVELNRAGMFRSPWHQDRSPSCSYTPATGVWCDHSRDNRGGDAFDLWCALNGYWPDGQDKPDRKGALRHLCPKEGQR